MKKVLSKSLSIILVVAILFLAMPQIAFAETSMGYTYTVYNGEATITKYTSSGGDITIPDTLGGYPVTIIGDCAFQCFVSLNSVIIPTSVTLIGANAFEE